MDKRQIGPGYFTDSVVADASEGLTFIADLLDSGRELAPEGLSMTNLLACAYLASSSLGAYPSEGQLATYDRFMREIERRCMAQAPSMSLETPIGSLVATTRGTDGDESFMLSIDLEKPDGTSGQVAQVEVVAGDLAEGYPTPLHVFAWDGEHYGGDPVCVDCNPRAEGFQETGWSMGERTAERGETPFVASAKQACKAAANSIDPQRCQGSSGRKLP